MSANNTKVVRICFERRLLRGVDILSVRSAPLSLAPIDPTTGGLGLGSRASRISGRTTSPRSVWKPSQYRMKVMGMALWLVLTSLDGRAAQPITVMDADNVVLTLNDLGRISVVISSNQDTQKLTRDTGRLLDSFQGLKDFREMVLVDLRNSLGNMVPAFVRMQMRSNLDKEAQRIQPFFTLNGNHENPRHYTHAIPDFDGKISDRLGWTKPDNLVRVVIFDRQGQSVFSWSSAEDPAKLARKVKEQLGQ